VTVLAYTLLVLGLTTVIMVGFALLDRRRAREIERDLSRAEPQPGRDSTSSATRPRPASDREE
jgi:hypothetical protein